MLSITSGKRDLLTTVLLISNLLSIIGLTSPVSCEEELGQKWTNPPAPSTTALPTQTPLPIILDDQTILEIIEFVAVKNNVSTSEVEISDDIRNKTTILLVKTYLAGETYFVGIKDSIVVEVGRYIEPEITGEQAYELLRDELAKRGIVEQEVGIDILGQTLENVITDVNLNYEESNIDYNWYPTHYYPEFSFLRELDEGQAVYEKWIVNIDSSSGEVTRLDHKKTVTFHNIKTKEEASEILSEVLDLEVDFSQVFVSFGSDRPGWGLNQVDTTISIILYDDGTIFEHDLPILLGDNAREDGSGDSFEIKERSTSSPTSSEQLPFNERNIMSDDIKNNYSSAKTAFAVLIIFLLILGVLSAKDFAKF